MPFGSCSAGKQTIGQKRDPPLAADDRSDIGMHPLKTSDISPDALSNEPTRPKFTPCKKGGHAIAG